MSANLELARLVGSYHARKVLGGVAAWERLLSPTGQAWLRDYRLYGVQVFEQDRPSAMPPRSSVGTDGAVRAVATLGRPFQELGEAIAENVGIAFAPMFADFMAATERIRRDMMYLRLRSAHVPDRLARWVADRYPLGWTLDAIRLRLLDFMAGVRNR